MIKAFYKRAMREIDHGDVEDFMLSCGVLLAGGSLFVFVSAVAVVIIIATASMP